MPPFGATDPHDVRTAADRDHRRTMQRAVFDARQRLTSTSGTRADYDFELLADYAGVRVASGVPLFLLVVILGLFAALWVPAPVAALWAGLVMLANGAVVYAGYRFRKRTEERSDARKWTAAFIAAETVYGIAWALLAMFTVTTGGQNLAVAMFAILLVGIAVNAVTTRNLPPATLMSTLPVTVTVSADLVTMGGLLNLSLAAVAVGAECFFLFLMRHMYHSEIATLEHQAEKDALIFELETERNISEEARRHAEQANIAKSRFLATMSHELRTPLNAIIGFSEVLKSELLGGHTIPQYKEYASDIHASGLHLLNLINELLDLSRIEAGRYDLNEEALALAEIADDCARMLKMRADAKSITITTKLTPYLPKIWGDERAIRQVVLNLLSNAIKFTPQSGKIVLTVASSPDGGQYVSVKDNGPGIPEEEIETVLSSFGQGSLAQKTAEQGAGLGLPIVQQIMELHQGRFDLFSKLRFGTEAIATFPRARVMDAVPPVTEKDELRIYSEAG